LVTLTWGMRTSQPARATFTLCGLFVARASKTSSSQACAVLSFL
jgi:hypothetical protein